MSVSTLSVVDSSVLLYRGNPNTSIDTRAIDGIAKSQRDSLSKDLEIHQRSVSTTHQAILQQMQGKKLEALKKALPVFKKAMESNQQTFEKIVSTSDIDSGIIQVKMNAEKQRVQHEMNLGSSIHTKQCAVLEQMSIVEVHQLEIESLGMELIPYDPSKDLEVYQWLEEEAVQLRQKFPNPNFHFNEWIQEQIRLFKIQYRSAQNQYVDHLLQASDNILNKRERNLERENGAEFLIQAEKELAEFYLQTAEYALKLDLLQFNTQLRKYQETLNLIFAIRIQHLGLLKEKIFLLNEASSAELEMAVVFHKIKLTEEGQKILQLLKFNELDHKKNEQRFSQSQEAKAFERKKLNELFAIEMQKRSLAYQHQIFERNYEEEIEKIRENIRNFHNQ